MAGKLLSYSAITTKVKAMEKNLIHTDDYTMLSNVKSTGDIVSFFKNHQAYEPYFSNVNEMDTHRGLVESILSKTVYESYAKIFHFANKNQRNILKLSFFRYEVHALQECLKHVLHKEATIDVRAFEKVFQNNTCLNLEALQNATSMEEFTNCLRGTEYYPLFNRLSNTKNVTLYDYQMELNIYYYKKIWKLKGRYLSGQELKDYTDTIGTVIDLQNIMSVYRCKKYYNVEVADILSIVIPISYHLKKEKLTAMIQASSMEEFVRILQTTKYRINSDSPTKEEIERSYYEKIYSVYEKNSLKNPVSMAPIHFFLYKKEREVDQLTTVLEGVRYGVEPDHIMQYLL